MPRRAPGTGAGETSREAAKARRGPRDADAAVPAPERLPKGWCVYLLRCGDGSLYTGSSNDLARRIDRHSRGKGAAYTRSRLPVRLVFWEPAAGRGAALSREAAVKRLTRAQKVALVGGWKAPPDPLDGAPAADARGAARPSRSAGDRPAEGRGAARRRRGG